VGADHSISAVAKNLELKLNDDTHVFSNRPDILVAGCGTGQHSLVTALRFSNCHVLAVDLSLSSLSHAIRKTQELGVSNIAYMQADILDLGNLNRQFDIVESVGVLHHMADPMEGWKVLVNCLKPNGLMKIGLYSELGRKSIVEARGIISTMGLDCGDDDIRKFREHVLNHEVGDRLERVAKMKDFFSISSCRDLLFHVQEHRFTLPQIKEALHALGLIFVGFESSNKGLKRKLKRHNPDPQAAYSLDAWHELESANPNTYRGLYQFWVQKNG
jgi:SAM-dependent methyltransferase